MTMIDVEISQHHNRLQTGFIITTCSKQSCIQKYFFLKDQYILIAALIIVIEPQIAVVVPLKAAAW